MQAQTNTYKNKYGKSLFLIFLIWPFLSFVMALQDFGNKYARAILIAFFGFFGYTLSLSREGLDGYKHARIFEEFKFMQFPEFWETIKGFFLRTGSNETDLYLFVTNFLISRFTSSVHVVFMFHSLVYGFFLVAIAGVLFNEFAGRLNKNSWIFFVLLFFVLPISNIHGIRFPLAMVIYVYYAYKFIATKNNKYLLLCTLTPLVHFSFAIAVLVLYVYRLLGNSNYIYLGLLALSFVAPGLMVGYLGSFASDNVSGNVARKISGYTNEDYIKARNGAIEGRNWYAQYRIPILQYAFYIVLAMIGYWGKKRYEFDKVQKNLLSFNLLFLAFVNFGFAMDSLGRRFLLLWFSFACIYMYRFFQLNKFANYSRYTLIMAFPIVLWVVVQLRVAFDITTYMWFMGNPISAYFVKMESILN